MTKNILLSILFISSFFLAFSQTNTFPTTGDAGVGTIVPVDIFQVEVPLSTIGDLFPLITGHTTPIQRTGGLYTVYESTAPYSFGLAFKTYKRNTGITEAMRISNLGKVGIGTSVPGSTLEVQNTTTDPLFSASSKSVLRTTLTNLGSQSWYISSGTTEVGHITFGTSAGQAGLIFLNTSGAGRSQIKQLAVTGGLGFGVGTTSTDPGSQMVLTTEGNVGIGTLTPAVRLEVNGNIYSNGKIFIGTPDANTLTKIAPYSLAVNGSAIFTKAVVKLNSAWPDYVFTPSYRMPQLDSLEQFIKANGHLPGIPKAETVEKNGIDIGENQAVLLKKIEELTLIVIEQNNKTQALESLIQQQNKKIEEQSGRIAELEVNSKKIFHTK